MRWIISGTLLAVMVLITAIARRRTRRLRLEHTARFRAEQLDRGPVSPLQQVFLDHGAPPPPPVAPPVALPATGVTSILGLRRSTGRVADPAAPPAPASAADPATDGGSAGSTRVAARPVTVELGTIFHGIELPCGLTPISTDPPSDPTIAASFATPGDLMSPVITVDELHHALDAALDRIGATTTWDGGATAVVERNGGRARLTVHPEPHLVHRPAGGLRYPTAQAGSRVVELTIDDGADGTATPDQPDGTGI